MANKRMTKAAKLRKLPSMQKIKDKGYRVEWLLHQKPRDILNKGRTQNDLAEGAGKRSHKPIINRLSREYSILRQKIYKEGPKTASQIGGLVRSYACEKINMERMKKIVPLLNKGYSKRTIGIILGRREMRKKPYSERTIFRTIKWWNMNEERLRAEGRINKAVPALRRGRVPKHPIRFARKPRSETPSPSSEPPP